jgi:hypothetical protein
MAEMGGHEPEMWEGIFEMKKLLPALALVAGAFTLAAPANAAVHVDFLQGTPVSTLAGLSVVNNFDTAAGITGSNFLIQSAGNSNGAQIPLADSQGTSYLSVLGGGTANLGLPTGTSDFAFEWGSLDTYNTLTIGLFGGGSLQLIPNQGQLVASPGNGNQTLPYTNGTLHVWGDAGEVFTGLKLQSGSNSFEIDNLAVKGAVPEPATWGMMLLGLGAVGGAMRRKRAVAVRFA